MSNGNSINIILIGDTGVGKTCLVYRYDTNEFCSDLQPTISIDFVKKTIDIDYNKVDIQIWDTAGKEKYRSVSSAYFRGSSGAIAVFDLTNKKSFDNVKEWIKEYYEHKTNFSPVVLAGNKCDLVTECLFLNDIYNYKDSIGAKYFETSAKNGQGVDELFYDFASFIYKNTPSQQEDPHKKVVLKNQEQEGNRGCCNKT